MWRSGRRKARYVRTEVRHRPNSADIGQGLRQAGTLNRFSQQISAGFPSRLLKTIPPERAKILLSSPPFFLPYRRVILSRDVAVFAPKVNGIR